MRIIREEQQPTRRRRPPYIMLLAAITLISASIWDLNIAWTPKSKLIALKGTFEVAATDISQTFESFRGGRYSHRSLQLKFRLKEHNKLFILIESMKENNESGFSNVIKELKEANEISIWIRNDEKNLREPTVFQIDTDKHPNLINLKRLRITSSPFAILMFLLGLAFLGVFYIATWPEKLHRLLFQQPIKTNKGPTFRQTPRR